MPTIEERVQTLETRQVLLNQKLNAVESRTARIRRRLRHHVYTLMFLMSRSKVGISRHVFFSQFYKKWGTDRIAHDDVATLLERDFEEAESSQAEEE